ncbi:MAG: tRNA-uridine aminocarboxypropyltransferase [Myxococcaceae bacterium]
MSHRDVCWRCRRPQRVCYCAQIPTLETRTRVVFLQHRRESRVAIGTARMAHLALPNSEFHVGIEFEGDPRIDALAQQPGTFLLFPSDDARPLGELAPGELKTLVVVDGTWPLAKKLIRINPTLQRLPRVSFQPERPGNYRIRREPAEHCLSTIEAVAEVVGQLEGEPQRLREMLRAFDAMVDGQIAFADNREGPSRHRIRKKPYVPRAVKVARELRELLPRTVLVYAESNAVNPSDGSRSQELLHLVASRPTTGERFEALIRPSLELSPTTAGHVEIPAEEILATGEERASALARWQAFLREDDAYVSWGWFTLGLLREAGLERKMVDLRERAIAVLKTRPAGLEDATVALGGARPEGGRGRAGRRHRALEIVLTQLIGALQSHQEK